jgi:hypothetical protein
MIVELLEFDLDIPVVFLHKKTYPQYIVESGVKHHQAYTIKHVPVTN